MDWLRELAVAAPAAFLVGLIVGFFIRSRYQIVKRNGNGKEAKDA